MHPDPAFRLDNIDEMRAFAADMSFGMLFATTPTGPQVAHVPICFLDDDRIGFHLSRGNGLARHLAASQALVVINGPQGYISPDWYGLPDQVPTWNYLAVEMQGCSTIMDQPGLAALIDRLSAEREARLAPKTPWTRDKMTPGLFDRMLGAVTGFEMRITDWRGTAKLGQNKPQAARAAVTQALTSLGNHDLAKAMGAVTP